jgi:hypothetical protein
MEQIVPWVRVVLFPLNIWALELLEGFSLRCIFGFNPAWEYHGWYRLPHPSVRHEATGTEQRASARNYALPRSGLATAALAAHWQGCAVLGRHQVEAGAAMDGHGPQSAGRSAAREANNRGGSASIPTQ